MLSASSRHLSQRIRSRPSMSIWSPIFSSKTLAATRSFRSTAPCSDFHFDTHHFVQRLEREGLNRAQAEGIMSAMAEVIDESIRNMTSNMVTKADQEKVYSVASRVCYTGADMVVTASLYTTSRLCADQIRAPINGKE